MVKSEEDGVGAGGIAPPIDVGPVRRSSGDEDTVGRMTVEVEEPNWNAFPPARGEIGVWIPSFAFSSRAYSSMDAKSNARR